MARLGESFNVERREGGGRKVLTLGKASSIGVICIVLTVQCAVGIGRSNMKPVC